MKNQAKSETTAYSAPATDHQPVSASAALAFRSPFNNAAAVHEDELAPTDSVLSYFQRLQGSIQQTLADQVTPLRLAGHLSVLAVAAVILLMSQMKLPVWNISLATIGQGVQENVAAVPQVGTKGDTAILATQDSSLQRSVIPNTVIADRSGGARQAIETYTVKSGDTVLAIAAKFGINPETIMWANSAIEQDPDKLAIGDQLNILPVNGVLYIVKSGDTLSSLASKYKVTVDAIVGYKPNQLKDGNADLVVGSQLVIPNGVKEFVQPQYATMSQSITGAAPDNANIGAGRFSWPVGGDISQRYWAGHPAIDISSWTGNPVKAADSGYVALASGGGAWNTGYGNYVIIDHGNGFTTLYAHMSSVFVKPGENVTRGEQIGLVGNTGHSTGPHLHFEIRYQGVQRNPVNYLP